MRRSFSLAAMLCLVLVLGLAIGRWSGDRDAGAASVWQLQSFTGNSQEEAFQLTKEFLATIDQACKVQTQAVISDVYTFVVTYACK